MKKKHIYLIILLINIIPNIVFAEDTCNTKDIIIKSVIQNSINGYTEEIKEPNISNNIINLDLKMYDVGDTVDYNILVKNNSTNTYYFDSKSFKTNNDYIEYSIKNEHEIIKANEEKNIQLRVTYKNRIANDNYRDNNKVSITLSDGVLTNPKTNTNYGFIIIIIVLISIILYTKIRNKKLLFLIISLSSMIPLSVMALCTVKLEIESNIEIDERNAIFLPGGEVNIKMKQLAGDNTSLSTKGYNFQNQSIMAIKSSLVEPDESKKQNNNVVSTTDSPYPIYMWYEEGNIYWWSEASRPSLNEDASNMFRSFTNLEDIADLARIDAKNSTTIQTMFTDNLGLETLHGLENWDTSNISNITGIFALNTSVYNAGYRSKLKDITALQNWNISKVTNLNQIFLNQNALIDLRGLENWDTSNVTSMQSTFGLMKGVSKDNNDIVDLTPLAKWDTSNVIYMNTLFQNVNLLSYEPLANWQTGNVQNFSNTFNQSDYSTTTSLKGLENWDVSSAKTLETMFLENVSLISADSINNWNVNATMNFTHMFRRTPVHPNFTKLPGIWDGYGTLIPNT